VVVLDQLVNDGRPFNWLDLLALQLRVHVTKAHNLPKDEKERFYTYAYLLDVIYAQHWFCSMGWTWTLLETVANIEFKLLFDCNNQGVIYPFHYLGVQIYL